MMRLTRSCPRTVSVARACPTRRVLRRESAFSSILLKMREFDFSCESAWLHPRTNVPGHTLGEAIAARLFLWMGALDTNSLAQSLSEHLDNPDFIKGWEVDKRWCVGAKRQVLRKAARDAKVLSRKGGPKWLKAIDALRVELAAAGEADFGDGMLAEALATCSEATSMGHETAGCNTAVRMAEAHLQRKFSQSAEPRDYQNATALAEAVRSQAAAWAAAVAAEQRARSACACPCHS